jgi:hypothetical protein
MNITEEELRELVRWAYIQSCYDHNGWRKRDILKIHETWEESLVKKQVEEIIEKNKNKKNTDEYLKVVRRILP